MKRWQAAAGAAFVAAAAAVLLGQPAGFVHEPVRLAPRQGSALLPDRVPAVAAAGRPAGATLPAPQAPRPSLASAYAQATDLRRFVLEALQRPQEGGLFYARTAAAACSGADQSTMDAHFRHAIASTGTLTAGQMRVADAVVRRCASFQPRETGRLFERAVLQSRDGSDPLVNAERELGEALAAQDARRMQAAVARVLELGDPHLLAQLVRVGKAGAPTSKSSNDVEVDVEDQALDQVQVNQVLSDVAIALAACRDDLPCDYDPVMQMDCLGHALCEPTREAHLRAWLALARVAQQDIDRLPALVARARRAMAEKDVAFFLR